MDSIQDTAVALLWRPRYDPGLTFRGGISLGAYRSLMFTAAAAARGPAPAQGIYNRNHYGPAPRKGAVPARLDSQPVGYPACVQRECRVCDVFACVCRHVSAFPRSKAVGGRETGREQDGREPLREGFLVIKYD